MHIFEDDLNMKLDMVSLFITEEEAWHLIEYIKKIIESSQNDHTHFISENEKKKLTICIYDPENLHKLGPRIQKLIQND